MRITIDVVNALQRVVHGGEEATGVVKEVAAKISAGAAALASEVVRDGVLLLQYLFPPRGK